mmetsp:Transcript_16028/g.47685  ORF Transcript_16028/g.47685 Transcript_16028/m.47685 type:complete len:349 (+) Transcript_16028:86-1132(+)
MAARSVQIFAASIPPLQRLAQKRRDPEVVGASDGRQPQVAAPGEAQLGQRRFVRVDELVPPAAGQKHANRQDQRVRAVARAGRRDGADAHRERAVARVEPPRRHRLEPIRAAVHSPGGVHHARVEHKQRVGGADEGEAAADDLSGAFEEHAPRLLVRRRPPEAPARAEDVEVVLAPVVDPRGVEAQPNVRLHGSRVRGRQCFVHDERADGDPPGRLDPPERRVLPHGVAPRPGALGQPFHGRDFAKDRLGLIAPGFAHSQARRDVRQLAEPQDDAGVDARRPRQAPRRQALGARPGPKATNGHRVRVSSRPSAAARASLNYWRRCAFSSTEGDLRRPPLDDPGYTRAN